MMKLNKIPGWLLLFLPALLFWLGWPPNILFFTLFFAFIPLFEITKRATETKKSRYFIKIFTALLLWNISLTWWVWNSTIPGSIAMLLLNSLFMCIPFLLWKPLHKKFGAPSVYIFIVLWLMYEYLHHRWDLSWPWLTLGNGLSGVPWLIQWYDITGTLGGSAFVLGMNVLLDRMWRNSIKINILFPVAFFLFFLISSLFNVWKYEKFHHSEALSAEVAVMQSNFDPWNEKFVRHPSDLIQEMEQISLKGITPQTQLLVWPETSLTEGINTDFADNSNSVQVLQIFKKKFPALNILSGADMEKYYPESAERPTVTARPGNAPGKWWDAFNSALWIPDTGKVKFYHKSILVPGTEQMPFTDKFPFIENLALTLDKNSISGSLGKSDRHTVFCSGKICVAPAVCYEGIYGDHVGQFVRQGANLIAIITNDAWWGNTPIYTQHLYYGRLRAIEHRRWIARSANSGISCFIDDRGNVVKQAEKFSKTALTQTVYLQNYQTLYSRMGDGPVLLAICLLCVTIAAFVYYRK